MMADLAGTLRVRLDVEVDRVVVRPSMDRMSART